MNTKTEINRIVDDPKELQSFFNAKINSVQIVKNRGYHVPKEDLLFIRDSKIKSMYQISDFKRIYIEQDKLIDNYYFRFLTDDSNESDLSIFEFIESNDKDWYEVVPTFEKEVVLKCKKNKKKKEDFEHVQTENNRIYASKKVYKKHFDKKFDILVVRFPASVLSKSKKGVKIAKPNKLTIQRTNASIPYHTDVKKIYCLHDQLTPDGRTTAAQVENLQIFIWDELFINKIEHVLVPEHILLSKTEGDKVKRIFGASSLSQISHNDPITKYYDAKINDVFLIIRQELVLYGSCLKKEHFRVVVYNS